MSRDGKLLLGKGKLVLCVDTGFTGDVALPSRVLERLDLDYIGPIDYRLADGSVQPMDQWLGRVVTGNHEYQAVFIEGDSLLGMDFIVEECRTLRINCATGEVTLTLRS